MVTTIMSHIVRDHRWLPVARPMPGEERTQALGVTRVAIRIGLLGFFIRSASKGVGLSQYDPHQ
jgi:hypothetical protein